VNNCALSGTCIAVSYVPKTQRCYFKTKLSVGQYNPNVIGESYPWFDGVERQGSNLCRCVP
jgi:hypothetical protein